MSRKLYDLCLTVLMVIAVFATTVWMVLEATSTPDVIFSYSTKQCIKVVNADGTAGDCNKLPKKFNHIWGK